MGHVMARIYEIIRFRVLHHALNMAIVKVGDQTVVDMGELRRVMDIEFELND
jgi:hypothetical protein